MTDDKWSWHTYSATVDLPANLMDFGFQVPDLAEEIGLLLLYGPAFGPQLGECLPPELDWSNSWWWETAEEYEDDDCDCC